MKKIFIILMLILTFCPSVFAENMRCTTAMKSKKPFVVLYTSDNCIYCKRFKPTYYKLSSKMSNKYNFVTVNVDKLQLNGECDKISVDSIPTLYIFNPKTGDKKLIPHYFYYKTDSLENELNKYYVQTN